MRKEFQEGHDFFVPKFLIGFFTFMPEKTKRKAIDKPFALIRKIGSQHFHDKGNVLHAWKYKLE